MRLGVTAFSLEMGKVVLFKDSIFVIQVTWVIPSTDSIIFIDDMELTQIPD
jgi:hypothetical protein